MTLEYLWRFAAARLLAWQMSETTDGMIAIGRLRARLRGVDRPIKSKLAAEIAKTHRALVEHMLHERGACCDETMFELVAAARAA